LGEFQAQLTAAESEPEQVSLLDYTLGSELQLLDQPSIWMAGDRTLPDLNMVNIHS
jgi:hypothetical protein